jgi:hypothetical protein
MNCVAKIPIHVVIHFFNQTIQKSLFRSFVIFGSLARHARTSSDESLSANHGATLLQTREVCGSRGVDFNINTFMIEIFSMFGPLVCGINGGKKPRTIGHGALPVWHCCGNVSFCQ